MFRQTRFSFSDASKNRHTLVLVQGRDGQQGAAVLDGGWVVLLVRPGEGRADYRRGEFEFHVASDRWGAHWTLTCGGCEFKEIPSEVRIQNDVLAKLPAGASNELVVEESARAILAKHAGSTGESASRAPAPGFWGMLKETTPQLIALPVILGLNVLIWFVMASSGAFNSTDRLVDWGALYAPRVADGQLWRLLSCAFLHGGFIHLFFNMAILGVGGLFVERVVGNLGFLALYVVSALVGSLASLYGGGAVVSVGSSGAVYGVYGGVAGLLFRYHAYVRRVHLILGIGAVLVLTVINVMTAVQEKTVMRTGVDISAHLGGFVGGFTCGLLMCRSIAPGRRWVRDLSLAGGALVLVLPLALARPRLPDVLAEFGALQKTMLQIEGRFKRIPEGGGRRAATGLEIADLLDREIIPSWTAAAERFEAAMRDAPSSVRPLVARFVEFAGLWRQGLQLLSEALRKNDESYLKVAKDRIDAAVALFKDLRRQAGED